MKQTLGLTLVSLMLTLLSPVRRKESKLKSTQYLTTTAEEQFFKVKHIYRERDTEKRVRGQS